VDYINSKQTTWQASVDQGRISKMTRDEIKVLLGTKRHGGPKLPMITYEGKGIKVPDTFDSRTNWPECATMKMIRDQSACGSCWAFGAVEAMSDRYCVFMHMNLSISAQDMNSCCDSCGDGCGGGYPAEAWSYWQSTGLVTEQCSPYSLPSCDHHMANSTNPCPTNEYPTPACNMTCVNGQNWNANLHLGSNINSAEGAADIQAEIFQNGPVETAFDVYEDFLTYSGGVYQHTTGDLLGGHAVKFLGWGVLNGTPYWLVANSWNAHWGVKGYFMILRGQDECGIEDEVDFGVPQS